MAAHDDGWNARVELGRRLLASMLNQPARATLAEMEAALKDEVERRAFQLGDLNELLYGHGGAECSFLIGESSGLREDAREVSDHARALVAVYQLVQALARNEGERC